MAKKYPLTQLIINKENKMEITLSELETQKVLEAGLTALGFDVGTVIDINVTQSRKTGKATIALDVNAFGIASEPKVEVTHVEEVTETVTETIEATPVVKDEEPEPEVVKETPARTFGSVTGGDSLFGNDD